MQKRKAVVAGATGLVGSHLIRELCESEEYESVTALVRRELDYRHPKLTERLVDFERMEVADMKQADDMFCCLGTTIKKAGTRAAFEQVDLVYPLRLAELAKNQGIPHFMVISAIGASEKAKAHYSRVKGKLERELIEMDLPRLSIIRPSLLTGKRDEFRLGEKAGEMVLKVMNPLLVGPMKRMRSVEAAQVALAMKELALHGKQDKVTVYEADELANVGHPVPKKG